MLTLGWICISILWALPLRNELIFKQSQEGKIAAITSLDESQGIGQSLNVTHNASRTASDVQLIWENGSSASHNIDLSGDWEGNSLTANITSLTDKRNWINGTLHFGPDDGNNSHEDNDTGWNGLDWNFNYLDIKSGTDGYWNYFPNNMSGNYNSSTTSIGKDSLELLMEGNEFDPVGYEDCFAYGKSEWATWSQNFSVPRGFLKDALLNFSVNPWHVAGHELWEVRLSIDGISIFTICTHTLYELCGGPNWKDFSIPLSGWKNITPVLNTLLDGRDHQLNVTLFFTCGNSWWSGPNCDYQQVFFSDVSLTLEADVKPEQINLTMNGLKVNTIDYGTGSLVQDLGAIPETIKANFTSENNASYTTKLQAYLLLNASSAAPTSCYEANIASRGVQFVSRNASGTIWDFYTYFSLPSGFVENYFTLYYPEDWVMTWVSTSQEPATNQLTSCDLTHLGELWIPVSLLTGFPEGFWKFRATSPNYLSEVLLYRNSSNAPGPSDWVISQSIIAGDFLNISAQTFTDKTFTDFSGTQAQLDFKFPNGSLWFTASQLVTPDSGGAIQFAPLQIPITGADYVAGDYKVFVRWNNTLGPLSFNETGLFVTSVRILHAARLQPDAESTVISDLLVGTTTTIKISFLDAQSGDPIEGASLSFTDLTGNTQIFTEYAPGYYIAEIYAPSGQEGSHILTVQETHPYFGQTTVTVQVEVVGAGMPPWVYYLMGAAIVALLAAFFSYQQYFKYPKIIRGIRGLRGRIGKGKTTHIPVKTREVSFTERYNGIVKQGGRLAAGIRSEFSVREFPEQALPSKSTQSHQEPPKEVKSASQSSPETPSQAPSSTPHPPQQVTTENVAPGTTTQHLRDQIVHMQQLAQILAETNTLQTKSTELEKRVKQAETAAAPNSNLIQLVTDLEKRFEKQKALLEQEQAKNKQLKGIQQIAKIATGVESRIQALQHEITQLQPIAVPITSTSGGMESLVTDLQQKIAQIEPLLKDADAQVSKLEYSLKWRKKK